MRNRLLVGAVVVGLVGVLVAWLASSDVGASVGVAGVPGADARPPTDVTGFRPTPRELPTSTPRAGSQPTPPLVEVSEAARGDERLLAAVKADAGAGVDETRAWLERLLERNAAQARRVVDRYCERMKSLRQREEFKPRPRTRDAAVFMAGRADWENGSVGLLHLPDTVTARLQEPAEAWRQAGPELYAGLDFSWLKALREFDHWSLATQGPLKDQRPVAALESPLPNYLTLVSWAKLRLLKGAHDHDLWAASDEVLHLAELCASNGSLLGELLRGAFHALVRGSFVRAGSPVPAGVFTEADRREVRDAALAGVHLLYPGVPNDVRETALACMPMRCAALNEAIGFASGLGAVRASVADDVRWLSQQQPCDAALATLLSHAPPLDPARVRESLLQGPLEAFEVSDAGQ